MLFKRDLEMLRFCDEHINNILRGKGGGFYDKVGADIGTKNPKKSALAAFIDISG